MRPWTHRAASRDRSTERAASLSGCAQHDHLAKHRAGWRVRQPAPGRVVIRTRAGVRYTTEPKRIIESLARAASDRPAAPLPDDGRPGTAKDADPEWFRKVAPRTGAAMTARTRRTATAPASHDTSGDTTDEAPPF